MKVLLFGDGPALKDKGKALREQNGWTVHLRTADRWAGDVEPADAVYFLEPADAIRAAYKARGIDCFLLEEIKEIEGEAGIGTSDLSETGAAADAERAQTGEETEKPGEASPLTTSRAKAGTSAGKRGK
jgi:hypothetical protein